jgi:hypothetical protein
MSFFNLEVLKRKPTKFIKIMPHVKLSNVYTFRTKKLKKQTKITTHMDLYKYGQILTIQKSLIIKWLRLKEKIPHMSLSSCVT